VSVVSSRETTSPFLPAVVAGTLAILAAAVVSGSPMVPVAATGVVVVAAASFARTTYFSWPRLLGALILIILFIPIRRYVLPGNLPLQIEPYRVFVAFLLLGWSASLLVDRRITLRKTGFEGPIMLLVVAAVGSIIANPDRVALFSSGVVKELMFFLSFILVVFVTASVIRRLDDVDFLAKTLVGGGAIVGGLAIVEARTGMNVFNHLSQVIPILKPSDLATPEMMKFGSARLRVFGSAQHPIALSAAFVMLAPLALYLARRYQQRRWWVALTLLVAGCASTVSRTGIVMFVVVALVFLWLRPKETRRMWPVLIPALIVIKLVLPGTLGAIKQSFLPAGGLVAEQKSMPGASGSGRLADIGPALQEWKQKPLFGEGYGTRVVDGSNARGPSANILDNQWLGTLLETGIIGLFAWLWFFARVVRRFGKEAKEDDSDRGWLLVSIAAAVAAFAVGMFTYDAFSFIQVTFLMFILVGLGSALLAERPTPLALRTARQPN
jgi:O-antigen ligase/polysaccharide polymerase Wzy-like membrane protein